MATEGDSLSVSQLGRQEHWGGRGVRGVRNGNREGGTTGVGVEGCQWGLEARDIMVRGAINSDQIVRQ